MATKYVTSKENIATLIDEVKRTNSLIEEAQPKDEFRNYALEMINNNIGNNLAEILFWDKAQQEQLGIINSNIVAIGEKTVEQIAALIDYANTSAYALQNINNDMVDTAEGIKAMHEAAMSDRLEQKEIQTEQNKYNEQLLNAIVGIGSPEERTAKQKEKAAKKKGEKDEKPKKGNFGAMMKDLGEGMYNAGKGLLAMGAAVWVLSDAFNNFAKVPWGGMVKGLVTLGALAIAGKMLSNGGGKDSWKPILAVAGAMWVLADAFDQFAKMDWGSLAKGLVVLGSLAIAIKLMGGASGALTILAVAGSMWVLAGVFEKFAAMDWGSLAKGLVVLGALAAVTALLGTLAPVVLLGAAAMLAIGAAMYVAAKAFEIVAESMQKFNAGLRELAEIDGARLLSTASALGALGLAMAAFGAGQAAAGLGTLVSNLLTIGQDSPVEQILKLANAGDGLLKTADGLSKIADAMKKFAAIDPNTMKAINDFPWIRMTAFAAAGGQMTVNGNQATIGKAVAQEQQQPAAQLANAQTANNAVVAQKEDNKAATAMAAATTAAVSNNKQTIVNNAGPTAVINSKSTKFDNEDMWARGGWGMMGA